LSTLQRLQSSASLRDRALTGFGRRLTAAVVVATLSGAAMVGLQRGAAVPDEGIPEEPSVLAAKQAMAANGLVSVGDAVDIDLDGERGQVAVVMAGRGLEDTETDLYRVTVDLAPNLEPIRVGPVFNLSASSGASERLEHIDGRRVLVSLRQARGCIGLMLVDFSGEPLALTASWSRVDRWKNRVTNWQQTGQASGLSVTHVGLNEPIRELAILKRDGGYDLGDGEEAQWALDIDGEGRVTMRSLTGRGESPMVQAPTKGKQGHLAWVVDTVRDLSWVGPEKVAAVEHLAFGLLDDARRARADVLGPEELEEPALAAGAQAETVAPIAPPPGAIRPVADTLQGRLWPPAPASPMVQPAGAHEGQWVPMTTLVRPSPDGSSYFVQSWLRPDAERAYARVSVTAWDPERVKLGVVAGTREPIPATGISGTGQIPRRPGLLPRLVAAFNGGFQTKHGAWGMRVEGRTLVPPAGEGATVATLTDGRTLLGTWTATGPAPDRKTLAPAVALPAGIDSLRQNLQPLVADGRLNPSGRRKWGSTAGEHVDDTHTTRTGICLLEGGALAYFFGASVSADTLGAAMLAYHCTYGVHLDMNAGHSGFEFYNVRDDEGEKFEAKRMIDKMWHMNFPRYIARDFRDFFYLTLDPLPSERLAETTGLRWTPVHEDGVEPPSPWEAPAVTLEARLVLDGLASPVRVRRVPRRGMTASWRGSGDKARGAEVDGVAVLYVNRVDADEAAELPEGPVRFGDAAAAPKPVRSEVEVADGIVVAWSAQDVLLAEVDARSRRPVEAWLEEHGMEAWVVFAAAGADGLGLRFVNAEGASHVVGGTSQGGSDVVWLRLPARQARTGRLEPLLPAPGGPP